MKPAFLIPTRLRAGPAGATRRVASFVAAVLFGLFVMLAWGSLHDPAGASPLSDGNAGPATPDVSALVTATLGQVDRVTADTPEGPAALAAVARDRYTDSVDARLRMTERLAEIASSAEPVNAGSVAQEPPPPAARVAEAGAAVEAAPVLSAQASPAPAVSQCNPPDYPTGAGFEVSCKVKIENSVGADGATASRVTTTRCLEAAGVLPPAGCTTSVENSGELVTSVDQCNGILAGGSNLTCSVEVINTVPEGTPTTGVTVNQCNGSGEGGVSPTGPPTDCAP